MGDGTKESPYTRQDVLRRIKENGGTTNGLDLSGKRFEEAIDLRGINLEGIILKKARLRGAHLERADLWGAHLEGAYIEGAHLTEYPDSHLGDADWGTYKIGEEISGEFLSAEHRYRHLKMWYADSGYHDIAAKFYYREKEANRKRTQVELVTQFKWESAWTLLWLWIYRLLCGYGEKTLRVAVSAIVIIFGFAADYYFRGSFSSSSFWDSLYYSAVSFTALGYGNWAPQPTGWAKGMGAAEAVIGVFMMALFLVTFTRKMTR